MLASLHRAFCRIRYYIAVSLNQPGPKTLDSLFLGQRDFYRMAINGDDRMHALADCLIEHAGDCQSLFDISVYEGYTLGIVAERTGARRVSGCDLSEVALQRARARLNGHFFMFDLQELWRNPDMRIPVAPHDVVLACEVLYYVGPLGHIFWRFPWLFPSRKMRVIQAIKRSAVKGVLVQHYACDVKRSIGKTVQRCGGYCVNEEWGIYWLSANTLGGQ